MFWHSANNRLYFGDAAGYVCCVTPEGVYPEILCSGSDPAAVPGTNLIMFVDPRGRYIYIDPMTKRQRVLPIPEEIRTLGIEELCPARRGEYLFIRTTDRRSFFDDGVKYWWLLTTDGTYTSIGRGRRIANELEIGPSGVVNDTEKQEP